MKIKTKIFIFTFIATLVSFPTAYAKAVTSIDPLNYYGGNYLNSPSQAVNSETLDDKLDRPDVLNVIPLNNFQRTTTTEETKPNITSTIGWKNQKGVWYYYKSDNTKAVGWIKPDNNWYYLNEDNGMMITGWFHYGSSWYYLDKSGNMSTGWRTIDNKRYFFNSEGVMVTGIQFDGSDLRYFNDSGVVANYIGWEKINDKWYYFDKAGEIKTGWFKENNTSYYLQGDGSMVTGLCSIDNNIYMFNDSGLMEIGWVYINGYWYYFNSDGDMATGWVTSNGSDYYYLDITTGKMLTNTAIDGYKLGSDGKRYKAAKPIPLSTSSENADSNMKKIYSSVKRTAKKYDLDSNLILAVIKAESNFNPKATSSSGAAGLMQIMPANFSYLKISDGYDIDENINGGSKLLKEYLDQFDGDVQIALAAYNAGPQTVKNEGVLSDNDLDKMSQGVQNYVKEVLKYYDENGANSQSALNTI